MRASNETQSLKDACFTKRSPLKINQPDEANLPLNYALNCPNCSDDGQLHGTDVVRGAITLLAAPGGRGKSSWLILMAIAAASGRDLLSAHIFGGPLRVLYINAEDSSAEIALRLHATLQHHGLLSTNLSGLAFVGADTMDLTLLQQDKNVVRVNDSGFDKLRCLLQEENPDIVIIDPLVSVMGGVSLNDNAAASILMKSLVQLAVEMRIGIVVAHHTSKGRDTATADAAMGAASFVNLARIVLSIERLKTEDTLRLGLPTSQSGTIVRVGPTKQNLSAPGGNDRLFRLVSVEVANAQPPIYPYGDRVGVIESFVPPTATRFSQPTIDAASACIAAANPPLSPSPRNAGVLCSTVAVAMAGVMGSLPSDAEAMAVINHLRQIGRVTVKKVQIYRNGRSGYERDGLVLV